MLDIQVLTEFFDIKKSLFPLNHFGVHIRNADTPTNGITTHHYVGIFGWAPRQSNAICARPCYDFGWFTWHLQRTMSVIMGRDAI